jgi:hypothetical protein
MAEAQGQESDTLTETATTKVVLHDGVPGQAAPSKTVVIPDLFESFLSRAPTINPHYHQVSEEAAQWASRWDPIVSIETTKTTDQVVFVDILKTRASVCLKQTSPTFVLLRIPTQNRTDFGLRVTG